jgi:DNA-binding transcriptional LysR family regulator
MTALLAERLADVALGPRLSGPGAEGLVSEPLLRYRLVFIGAAGHPIARAGRAVPVARLATEPWFVDPAGADPGTEVGQLIARLGVPDGRVRVFPNVHTALAAAATGSGVVPAVEHLVAADLDATALVRLPVLEAPVDLLWHVTSLGPERRPPVVGKLRRYLATPDAMQAMYRADGGVPASRFKPPVYVTIWS